MSYLDFQPPDGPTCEELAEHANTLPPTLEEAYAAGRDDERADVRAEVLRELLEWEAEYMQQARGGDQSGRSDARADAAREIHDHLRSSWETRNRMEAT